MTNACAVETNDSIVSALRSFVRKQKPVIQYRTVSLCGIQLPVRVEHAKLDKSERLDSKTSRVDILDVSVKVVFEYNPIVNQSFEKIWNYSDVYRLLCESDIPVLTGPLENVLDQVIDTILNSASQQGVVITYAEVSAKRVGLSIGCPVLRRTIGRKFDPLIHHTNMRSAGVSALPLSLRIDHSWAQENDRIEHKDVRSEVLSISFDVFTKATALSPDSLKGLMNYVSTVEMLDRNQNSLIDQASESVVDLILSKITEEVDRCELDLCAVDIRVERNGYARLKPTLGLLCAY
jgi:hypothetical protein